MSMLGVVAEFERALIRERVKECVAMVQSEGVPPANLHEMVHQPW
ncbi:hypothetical protein [Propionivibrio sp.]